ncbi:hypothetical protein BHE74_00029204 [Ensete ventricosum]|nr:hypothetical protein BHE74_00029204 [Ensete ventricosum]
MESPVNPMNIEAMGTRSFYASPSFWKASKYRMLVELPISTIILFTRALPSWPRSLRHHCESLLPDLEKDFHSRQIQGCLRGPWWLETWRNYALRESVESKDKVSGSGKLGVIVRELGEWQSIIDPRVPEHSPTCRWGPLVSSCVASGGIYGVTKRLGWALGDIDRGGIINYTN